MPSVRTSAKLFNPLSMLVSTGETVPAAAPKRLPGLGPARFICREPRYVGALRRAFWAAGAGALAYSALVAATPSWFVLLASGLAALAAIGQSPGQIHFVCAAKGVFFPARSRAAIAGQALPHRWLFIPWSNISTIGVQLLLDESGSRKGVVFSVRASDEERRVYFPGAAMPSLDARSQAGNRALIRVGYAGVSRSPQRIAALLRRLQARSTSGGAPRGERTCHEAVTTST